MKASGVFSRKSCVACALALALFPAGAWAAFIDGEVIPVNRNTHIYNVKLDSQTITNNTAGATAEATFSLQDTYDAVAFCSVNRSGQPIWFEGRSTAGAGADGWVTLNEYMDAQVSIHIEGEGNGLLSVPFPATSNKMNKNICRAAQGATEEGYPLSNVFGSGSQGKVTFRLRKPLINGITITGTEVAEVFGRLEAGDGIMGPTPLARVVIDQAIITVPDKCVVNDGEPVMVDFGQIPNSAAAIEKNAPAMPVDIRVKCEGGSFATPNAKVRIGILQGSPASFNSDYLSTTGPVDRSDLGISLTDNTTNQQVVPNTLYDFIDLNTTTGGPGPFEGLWSLTAKPVAKSGTMIPEGDFEASATIVTVFE